MPKNKINSRLTEFFSELHSDQEDDLSALVPAGALGYNWETDASGLFTECGAAVESVLGFTSTEVIGNPLLSFQLPSLDQKALLDALNEGQFPVEIELDCLTKTEEHVLTRLIIFQKLDKSGQPCGFRGYCEKLAQPTELASKKSETRPLKKSRSKSPEEKAHKEKPRSSSGTKDLKPLDKATPQPVNDADETLKFTSGARKKRTSTRELTRGKIGTSELNPDKTSPVAGTSILEPTADSHMIAPGLALTGLSLIQNKIEASTAVWTAQAQTSFDENRLVALPSVDGAPAILAAPLTLRDEKTGVIEIIDEKPDRVWTDDDRLLFQEVTKQLGLSLENTQLNSAIQRELSERVKAERETLRRNKDLANLNLIGQQLNRLVDRNQIYETVSAMTQKIMGVDNLLLTLYDRDSGHLSFPICVVNGINTTLPPRTIRNGYQESILETRKAVLINRGVSEMLEEKQIDHSIYMPYSLMAVPLNSGERALGVLSVFDYQNEDAFDQIQLELLSSVGVQVATALENTNLFNEIRESLQLIERRQQIQSNITDAVAELSLKGTSELPFLLKSFAQATDCDRAYYADTREMPGGDLAWQSALAYINPNSPVTFDAALIRQLKFEDYPKWASRLAKDGWYAVSLDGASGFEKEYLSSQKLQTLLLLSIKTEDSPAGFIALEHCMKNDEWKPEEIDILRVASDAYANTVIRERLLEKLSSSLSETEHLYTASHRLALAENMQAMISAVLSSFSESAFNRGEIVLFDYGLDGKISRMTTEAAFPAAENPIVSEEGVEVLVSLYEPIYSSAEPLFIENIADSSLSQTLKDILIGQNIKSMAMLPLWSGRVQIGSLLLQSEVVHPFTTLEIRSFPPLADQMATAIQNLRLFERTQVALSETETLYKISSGIAKSTNMEELTTLVGQSVLPENFDSLFLFIVSNDKPLDSLLFEIASTYSKLESAFSLNLKVAQDELPFLQFNLNEPLIIPNTHKPDFSETTTAFFKKLGIASALLIPLQTALNPVGFLLAGARQIVEIDPQEAHTLQIIGNSIAVAIERQRLLFEAQRRALELQTAAEIARDTTGTLSQEILLSRIVNLLKDRFGYYHCSIFLLDESNKFAVVEESTGEVGKIMKQNRHKVTIGSKSVIGTCIASGQPVIVNDTNLNPIFLPNPLLLDTRSEMGIPLRIGGRIIGALDLQSTSTNAFSDNELTVLKILSDQISVAIENARSYSLSQQAVQEMRELDRVKSQFLANMSHELRTPLNSVIGFSRVILKGIDGPINKVQEQDITSIYNSGMNLLNMINEILDVSKIEAGKMELQLEEVSIAEIISKAVSTAMGLIKDKPVELIQRIEPGLPLIKGDQIKLGQVVLNLLSNAIKFTEKGTITIEAALVKGANLTSEIKVSVADSGVGIAEEDQQKLFQRFSQVDDSPTRKTGGTGLGLAISRSLIELHGGKIGLESSQPGKGSVFFFTLPVVNFPKGLDVSNLTHGDNVILSIDDDPQVIALYERYLKNYGFEVVGLTDPSKSLEKACELKPFAITLDIMMPQVDGWQVLHDLKQDERTRDIPILVCSIIEEEDKGFNLGASEYLVKPFLQGDLINAMRRINRDGSSLEVLVIDDDPDDLKFVKKMVEAEPSFHPVLAQGGRSALQILNNLTPDLIILDLFMPDMNGFELLDQFKTEPRWSRIPVIVLTGAELTPEQKNQLAESSKALSTHGLLKESDILKNMEEALERIKPLSKEDRTNEA